MEMPFNYVQQGWQCPICKKVYAPWVSSCNCNNYKCVKTTEPNTWETTQPTIYTPTLNSERLREYINGYNGDKLRNSELEGTINE